MRESAVEALGEVGGEAAIEFIKSALNDEDGSVRELAQETLEELNAKSNSSHTKIFLVFRVDIFQKYVLNSKRLKK